MSGRQRAHDQPECPHCDTDLLVSGCRGRGPGAWRCHGCSLPLDEDGNLLLDPEVGGRA